MRQAQAPLVVTTDGPGLVEITAEIGDWVRRQAFSTGLLTVYCRHTSASLLIQENADPTVLEDLAAAFARLAPESGKLYRHNTEGPDDMPSHIRAALTGASLSIPIAAGALTLGRWQGILMFEHRRGAHRREIVLHAIGD